MLYYTICEERVNRPVERSFIGLLREREYLQPLVSITTELYPFIWSTFMRINYANHATKVMASTETYPHAFRLIHEQLGIGNLSSHYQFIVIGIGTWQTLHDGFSLDSYENLNYLVILLRSTTHTLPFLGDMLYFGSNA